MSVFGRCNVVGAGGSERTGLAAVLAAWPNQFVCILSRLQTLQTPCCNFWKRAARSPSINLLEPDRCLFQLINIFWSQAAQRQVIDTYEIAPQPTAAIDVAFRTDAFGKVGHKVFRS